MGVPLTKMWRTQEKPHIQELKPLVPRPPTLPTKAMAGGGGAPTTVCQSAIWLPLLCLREGAGWKFKRINTPRSHHQVMINESSGTHPQHLPLLWVNAAPTPKPPLGTHSSCHGADFFTGFLTISVSHLHTLTGAS